MIAGLADFKRWIGVSDTVDDAVMQQCLDSAEDAILGLCEVPEPAPADVVAAQYLLASRLLARRNSPDGLVGLSSEFGPARISTQDRDVQALLVPYKRLPAWA